MGTDIHVVFEYYDNKTNRWRAMDTEDLGEKYKNLSYTDEEAKNYLLKIFCGYEHTFARAYVGFEFLGCNRENYGLTPIQTNNIPTDLHPITIDRLERWGGDAHTKRVLTLTDIETYVPSDTTQFPNPYLFKKETTLSEADIWKQNGLMNTLRKFLTRLEKAFGNVRMLYWFDN